jgi:Undecaprenyl-phosphate glucose phosphotransferase
MCSFDIRAMMKAEGQLNAESSSRASSRSARKLSPLAERLVHVQMKRTYSPILLTSLSRLTEFVLILCAGAFAYNFYLGDNFEAGAVYLIAVPLVSVLNLMIFQSLGCYEVTALRSPISYSLRIIGGWALVIMIALVAAFFAKIGDHFSRIWLLTWFVSGAVLLLIGRAIISVIVRQLTLAGRLDRRTAIVGGGAAGESFIRALSEQPDTGIRICGVFDERDDDRSPDMVAGYPKLGTIDDLVEFARLTKLDLVVFTLPISAESRILQMLSRLWVLPVDIRLAAHTSKLRLRPKTYSYLGTIPVLDVFDKPMADWDVVLKWLFDKIVGLFALIALSPIMVLTALAIKLDSKGSILFRQKRYGFNNELIEVFKFRSMYTDQSDIKADKLVTKNDPRVTRVGRFIRKTSLDELPQLFNVVFKGNLSLVGPRPHAVNAKADNRLYDHVVDGYFARHKVKPGITGWAQINGWRGETDTEEKIQQRVQHDLFYIENWSILLDFYILVVTPFALMKTENAY